MEKKTRKERAMTHQQKLFCEYYARTGNGSESYKRAYGTDIKKVPDNTARTNASKLLTKQNILEEVSRIKEEVYKELMIQPSSELISKEKALSSLIETYQSPMISDRDKNAIFQTLAKTLGWNEPEKTENININQDTVIVLGFDDEEDE